MHYYPHHIGDYRSATSHLSNEEDLAYRRLLEMYYDTEQPIPLEIQQVARRLRVTEAAVQVALTDFFEQKKDGWHHARCESEIEKYKASSTKKSVAGKASGLARAAKKEQVLNTRSTGVEQNANGVELTKNQEPETNNQVITPPAKKSAEKKPEDVIHPPIEELFPEVEKRLLKEWEAIRRTKALGKVTLTAAEAVRREAKKAKLDIRDAIKFSVERSWGGFNATWYAKDAPKQKVDDQFAGLL